MCREYEIIHFVMRPIENWPCHTAMNIEMYAFYTDSDFWNSYLFFIKPETTLKTMKIWQHKLGV